MKILYYILAGMLTFPSLLTAQDEIGKAIEKQLQILKNDSDNMQSLKEIGMLYGSS